MNGYGGGAVQGQVAQGGGGLHASKAAGILPFTGLNLAFVVAIALALIVLGFVIRRRTSSAGS